MSKTAIVVGGTGVVGRELVAQLSEAKHISKVLNLTRRPVSSVNNKVVNHVIDFTKLREYQELFAGDLLFSSLGTTRKQAGSVAAQRRVDLDYQLECAELAAEHGVKHYLLVSSSGANRHSPMAYPKMKGELEHQVKQLSFVRISIFQPSLLLGERNDKRIGEEIAAKVLPTVCKLPFLAKARPISGAQVAQKMVQVSAREFSGGKEVETYTLDEVFPT